MSQIAIVTGSSAGIGEALTTALLAGGWEVVGVARREVTRSEPGYRHIRHDLEDVSALPALESALDASLPDRRWTRLALVNNAASQGQMRVLERLDPMMAHHALGVNLIAPLALMRWCLRTCPEGTPLRIVNVSSGAATAPLAGLGDYCTSKAALRMLGMVLGSELEASGRREVAVLSYEPGIVDTTMQTTAREQSKDDFPSVGLFHHFHREGMLVPAVVVVEPIVEFLEGNGPPGFHELRFGEGAEGAQ